MSVCSYKKLTDSFVTKILKSCGFSVNRMHIATETRSHLSNRLNL